MRVAVGFDLFQHHEELHWETCNKRVLLRRVEDKSFFSRGTFVGMIMVVMLDDDELIGDMSKPKKNEKQSKKTKKKKESYLEFDNDLR